MIVNILLILSACITLLITRLFLVLPRKSKILYKQKKRIAPCRACIFLGSGGHTAEMLQLVKSLDPVKYNPRSYVLAETDMLSKEKAIEYELNLNGEYKIYQIPRVRKVGQPFSTVPLSSFNASFKSIKVLLDISPDVIVCNGPGSCIPICMLSYIPRILGLKKIEIIYIESFARVETLSLTGRLLYPFVDRFLVQWPDLCSKYKRAEYNGVLV